MKHHVSEPHFNYLSPQDILVIAGIREENDDWRGTASYHFSPHHCFLALVNHPHLAHCQNREISIELVKNEPELHIEETPQGYHFSLSHFLPQPGFIIEPESLNKYRVIDYSTAFASIGNIITEKGLTIPANAKDKILDIIHNAKRDIKIHVGIKDPDIPEIVGDAKPCIQLLPMNEGVRATLWVKPLSYHGSYFKIAQGKESFMAIVPENGVERWVRGQRFKFNGSRLRHSYGSLVESSCGRSGIRSGAPHWTGASSDHLPLCNAKHHRRENYCIA